MQSSSKSALQQTLHRSMSNLIGVMGCGWLGKPLAISLLKKGYVVKGTTTQVSKLSSLRDAGIDPYVVNLQHTFIDGGIEDFLEHLNTLIINIPPGLRASPQSDYSGRIKLLMEALDLNPSIKQLIYISSTGVFKDQKGNPSYSEKTAPNADDVKGAKLIAAERVISTARKKTTIIRPGGLIGDDRHPIKYLAGKTEVSNPEAPINLTNRDYLIDVIHKVVTGAYIFPVLHAISEPHEDRINYYTRMAQTFELEPPVFSYEESIGKRIVSTIL